MLQNKGFFEKYFRVAFNWLQSKQEFFDSR